MALEATFKAIMGYEQPIVKPPVEYRGDFFKGKLRTLLSSLARKCVESFPTKLGQFIKFPGTITGLVLQPWWLSSWSCERLNFGYYPPHNTQKLKNFQFTFCFMSPTKIAVFRHCRRTSRGWSDHQQRGLPWCADPGQGLQRDEQVPQ